MDFDDRELLEYDTKGVAYSKTGMKRYKINHSLENNNETLKKNGCQSDKGGFYNGYGN